MTERNRLQIYFGNVEIRFPLRRKSETMANCDLNCSLSSAELNMLHVMTFAKISQKKKKLRQHLTLAAGLTAISVLSFTWEMNSI